MDTFTMRGFPHATFPQGWYQIGWSGEIKPKETKSMRYFSEDLVCFRGESGKLYLMDAHCPHLGAHLGVGGCVENDNIRCPFHGWVWDCDGKNIEIPYSEKINRAKSIKTWEVREVNEQILTWYDSEGKPPAWEPPQLPETIDSDYYSCYPNAVYTWDKVRVHPQFLVENSADIAHFQFVHRAPETPKIELIEVKDHYAHLIHKYPFGKKPSDLTPDGTIWGQLEVEAWGIGLVNFRLIKYFDMLNSLNITPIDEEHSDIRSSVWVKKADGDSEDVLSGNAEKAVKEQFRITDFDVPIWENMLYIKRAPLVAEEAKPYAELRKWCDQFYAVPIQK
ncbi:Rieske 2Fe-2S domain-containing protein [Peribacillus butanolivorans]